MVLAINSQISFSISNKYFIIHKLSMHTKNNLLTNVEFLNIVRPILQIKKLKA